METEKIFRLAISYFEGTILPEDETTLFKFVNQNYRNRQLFHQWETNWSMNPDRQRLLQTEWDSIQVRLEARRASNVLLKPKRIPLYRRVAAVAAIIIITIVSTLAVKMFVSSSPGNNSFIVEAPNGEKSRVTLPDGTIVWLNSATRIAYNSQFNALDREVELDGEAYFEVAKHEKLPFRVKTRGYDVVVKGTKFNIASYRNDKLSTTTLMEGKVEVIFSGRVLKMSPGEQVQLDNQTREYSKTEVNPLQYKSWIDNRISFDAISLDELLNRLSRQYDVDIHLQADNKNAKILNISIKNDESINEILDGLSKVTPMEISREGRNIYIRLK